MLFPCGKVIAKMPDLARETYFSASSFLTCCNFGPSDLRCHMNRTVSLSQQQLRDFLRLHQRRLAAGDKLPTLSDIALRAGLHRDTLYALLDGDRVEARTQNGLSRVVREIEDETAATNKTRLLSIRIEGGAPRLRIGLDSRKILA